MVAGLVAMTRFAQHRVVVTRRHDEKQSGTSSRCSSPPPNSKLISCEWVLGAECPTEVDGRSQRSASAPAVVGGGSGSGDDDEGIDANWRGQACDVVRSRR